MTSDIFKLINLTRATTIMNCENSFSVFSYLFFNIFIIKTEGIFFNVGKDGFSPHKKGGVGGGNKTKGRDDDFIVWFNAGSDH